MISAHPDIQAGAPCVTGTRVPARLLWHYWKHAQRDLDQAARAIHAAGWDYIDRDQIIAAIWFEEGRRYERKRRKRT